MKTEKSNCKLCSAKFVLKRSDQKFCSNKCRSRYFNKNNILNSEIVKKTNNRLLKDYKILAKKIGTKKEVKVLADILRFIGFSFNSCTSFEEINELGDTAPALYDLCYYRIDDLTFKIKKL